MNQEDKKQTRLGRIVKKVRESEISSIKNIVLGLIRLINDPESSAGDFKEIIQIDPPLTGKLLKLANSAYYAPQKEIWEIEQAMIWVGFDALKELAINQKVHEVFKRDGSVDGFSRNVLWKHCVAVALLGKWIYRREFCEKGGNIYVAGLLHDIGIIALEQFCYSDYIKIVSETIADGTSHHEKEREVLGFDHADMGRAITTDWNLPRELCEIVGGHHEPESISEDFSRIGLTLYVADYVCQQRNLGYLEGVFQQERRFKRCLEKLELTTYAVNLIAADVEREVLRMEQEGLL
jgi:HD-like signal output (HDOD) protein